MARGKISNTTVAALQSGPTDTFLWDEDVSGFGVKVTPRGKKVYLIQYRLGGGAKTAPKRYTIGPHGTWTPTSARTEAKALLARVHQGVDPSAEKEARERAAIDLAFSAYADRFLKLYVRPEWPSSYVFAEGCLRLHVKPVLRSKPLPSITKSDLNDVLDRIPTRQTALRRNVYAVVRRLFRWAKGRGDLVINPLEDFEAPPAPSSRDRWLADWELRLVWLAAGALKYPWAPFYRLLIATGQRREEVAGLDWRELRRGEKEWTLPAERAKNGVSSLIPLNSLAIEELDAIAGGAEWPRSGLVLTTTSRVSDSGALECRPISGFSKCKRRVDAAVAELVQKEAEDDGGEALIPAPWRLHDLRRTLATGLQRLGIRFEVTEAVLNHVSGSKAGVAGIYQRHDWRTEKRAALDAWASHLRRIVDGRAEDNVVALRS